MKGGTIVAQVDSSESFQEFCSTGCLAAYEKTESAEEPAQNKVHCLWNAHWGQTIYILLYFYLFESLIQP